MADTHPGSPVVNVRTPMSVVRIASLATSAALASLLLSSPATLGGTLAPTNLQMPNNVPTALQLSVQQRAQIQQVFAATDTKIRAAMRGQEAQTQAMQLELKAIGAIRDPAQKHQAIRAYQAKYAATYQGILGRAGVNLAALPSQLNTIAPSLQFQLRPDLTLAGRSKTVASAAPATPVGPRTTTTKVASSAYEDHKTLGCGLGAGGNVSFGATHVTNSVVAAEAGGCENDGEKSANITIPAAASSAHLDASADLSAECFAVGILGAAECVASAYVDVIEGSTRVIESDVHITVFAPFLWAGSGEESTEPARVSADLRAGKTYELLAATQTIAWAGGAVAETHGSAHISELDASVTITQ